MTKRARKTGARVSRETAALSGMAPVLSASAVGVAPPTAEELIEYVSRFAWDETLVALSLLSAMLANHDVDSPIVRGCTVDPFLSSNPTLLTSKGRALREALLRFEGSKRIANEACILFLQALVILYGRDGGPRPSDGNIAEMLLTGNEYAFGWHDRDVCVLTRSERSVADTSRALGFNRAADPVREVVRASRMLANRPNRPKTWPTDEHWRELHSRAFGMPLDEYLEAFAIPIMMISTAWGNAQGDGFQWPLIDPTMWWRETSLDPVKGERCLRDMASTREEAAFELRKRTRADRLAVGPAWIYRKPFIELPSGKLVGLSPWMVREQLRGGLWGRCRAQTDPTSDWPPAFGELFEDWCQRVASMASVDSVDDIITPTLRGTDDGEVEDIIIRKNDSIAFVSVKAGAVPEATMRGARSRQHVLDWFEQALFAGKGVSGDGQHHRGGAVRLLDAKVSRLRSGAYEARGLGRELKVFPVLISYEHCFDSPAVYEWAEKRCRDLGLLQQSRVHPLTFGSVEELEGLLALSTRRRSAIDILRQKVAARWRYGRFGALLHERAGDPHDLRLPELAREFSAIMNRVSLRSFGRVIG